MINRTTVSILLFFLTCTATDVYSQIALRYGLGISAQTSDVLDELKDAYFFSARVSLPLELQLTQRFGLRIEPALTNIGSRLTGEADISRVRTGTRSFLTLRAPIELLIKPQIIPRVNFGIGVGVGYIINGYDDITIKTTKLLTGRMTIEKEKGSRTNNEAGIHNVEMFVTSSLEVLFFESKNIRGSALLRGELGTTELNESQNSIYEMSTAIGLGVKVMFSKSK